MSKSPNPQNKLITNTNYGKFKGANGMPVNSVYTRNPGIGGQYLPKLGSGAGSQAQLSGVPSHQQQQMLQQQSSSSQLQSSYQRQKIQPGAMTGVHTSSQQNMKSINQVGNPVIKTSQAMNFRQNLNISLQQIAKGPT
jgi:hypothetical protein